MISVDNISARFGAFDVFSGVTFVINPRDRIGLVGRNGSGKTTLFRIIAGLMKPSSGRVEITGDLRIGYLPQQMVLGGKRTTFEEARSGLREIVALEKKITALNEQIGRRKDFESAEYAGRLDQLAEMNERYRMLNGDLADARVERMLTGLGFEQKDIERSCEEFSGGWRMRIELARLLLEAPDVLLLDEPTNHLDIESIRWLEEFLGDYDGAVFLVSHDRAFLDGVTRRTIELFNGRMYDCPVSYSGFVNIRQERQEHQTAAYRNQQRKIQAEQQFIDRFRYKATKAKQVQSRIRKLEKMDPVETGPDHIPEMNLNFSMSRRSGRIVAELSGVAKSFGDQLVFRDVNMVIERRDRLAFVGRNGEGKTTLSRIIAGDLDHEGAVRSGYNVDLGYYAQDQDRLMDPDKTVLETIDLEAAGPVRTRIRSILGAFLFGEDDIQKKVKVLSGGERSRLSFARMLVRPCNFLILDEPTNHLDMRSRDILKAALLQFEGTMVVVSHDREFLDGLVQKVYEFRNARVTESTGGIYDFLRKRKLSSLREVERKDREKKVSFGRVTTENKHEYFRIKEHRKKVRKLKNNLERTENRIESIEKQLSRIEENISSGDGSHDPEIYREYEDLKKSLDEEMERWEKLQTKNN